MTAAGLDDRSVDDDPQGGNWCAEAATERGETMVATASRVARWLLVEHTTAWGPESVPTSRLPAEAAAGLNRVAGAAGARLLMVRRTGPHRDDPGRWVFAVRSLPGRERVLAAYVTDDAELATLAPPYDDGVPAGWTVRDEPLYLVCTHGRHDRCCALRGRPVAKALAAEWGDAVWESSHLGGDRFAANLVVLPEGLYLGRVEPSEAVALVQALERGVLDPAHVRGRSSLPAPVQAAQAFARAELGLTGRDDLQLEAQEVTGRDLWRVRLSGGVTVDVRYDRAGDNGAQLLTCDAREAKTAPVYRLVSLSS